MKARARPDSASAPCAPPARGIAGRKDHPIGVELQRGDLGGRQIAVVLFAGLGGRRQEKAGLAIALNLTGQRAVGRKMHDAVLCELAGPAQLLHIVLGGAGAEIDAVQIGVHIARHAAQLLGRLGQRRLKANLRDACQPAARGKRRHAAD